jgi:hypothetical protein
MLLSNKAAVITGGPEELARQSLSLLRIMGLIL